MLLSHSNDRRTESLARQSVNDLPNRCAIFNSLTLIAVKEMCIGVSGGLEPSGQSTATLHCNDPRWTHGVMRWFEREKRALGRTSRCYQDRVGSSGLLTSHGDREHRKRPVRRQHQRPSPSCRSLGGVVTNDVQKDDRRRAQGLLSSRNPLRTRPLHRSQHFDRCRRLVG